MPNVEEEENEEVEEEAPKDEAEIQIGPINPLLSWYGLVHSQYENRLSCHLVKLHAQVVSASKPPASWMVVVSLESVCLNSLGEHDMQNEHPGARDPRPEQISQTILENITLTAKR
ncbi:hypothetical protein Leryth_000745 [Lithospermum erythrorhizon]|nr:hypothetical protein Leryth_000745 [Lithospermum erythrorhizon]